VEIPSRGGWAHEVKLKLIVAPALGAIMAGGISRPIFISSTFLEMQSRATFCATRMAAYRDEQRFHPRFGGCLFMAPSRLSGNVSNLGEMGPSVFSRGYDPT
jgi:hypothetical protein